MSRSPIRVTLSPSLAMALCLAASGCGDDVQTGPDFRNWVPRDLARPGGDGGAAVDGGEFEPGDMAVGGPDLRSPPDLRPSCDDADKRCAHEFSYTGNGSEKSVEVRGDFRADGWAKGEPMTAAGNTWTATVELPWNKAVQYKLFVTRKDGTTEWLTDPANPKTTSDTYRNSLLDAETCPDTYTCPTPVVTGKPSLELLAAPTVGKDSYSFKVRFVPGAGGDDIDTSATVVTLNGKAVTVPWDGPSRTFTVSAAGIAANKYGYLFRVKDKAGTPATLLVPLWVEASAFSWQDALIYQIITDRFVNGDAKNDAPVGAPVDKAGDWQGGDFRGIIQKLEAGYFAGLGVNALWISSPVLNPSGHEPGKNANTGHEFSAYHSYWPIATGWTDTTRLAGITSPVEKHFGTADELRELVNKAHARGVRILVDFVPNHVHKDAPLWKQHADDAQWWNLPYDDCSVNNGWDARRTTCWFDPFLADFKCSAPAVRDTIVSHAVWLVQEFNLDGFRVDATKHVETEVLVDLRQRLKAEVAGSGSSYFYMVGETLGGDEGLIKECIGASKLDGSVNDPFHWAARDTFLQRTQDAVKLEAFAVHDTAVWKQHFAGALMGNFFGSHDTERAVSIAAGNAFNDRWKNPPPTPTDARPFKRLRLAQAFLLGYPSIPIILMGDELGQPGAADPDNRRMMIFDAALSALQKQTLAHFGAIGKARLAHPALRRGARSPLVVESEFYAFARKDGADVAIVALNLSESPASRMIDVSSLGLSGALTDAVSGAKATVSGGRLPVSLDGLTAAVLVP